MTLHVVPLLGKVALRRLRYQQIEALYDKFLHPPMAEASTPRPSTRSIW